MQREFSRVYKGVVNELIGVDAPDWASAVLSSLARWVLSLGRFM